jgi:hypothetical protein
MKSLTKRQRLRRVARLCCCFTRNLAYRRAGHHRLTAGGDGSEFLSTTDGNFLDTAVIEWCKLFGDRKAKHYWGKIVSNQDFEADMLKKLDETPDQFEAYIDEMRVYRDKFLAHLDDDLVMYPPKMNRAKVATEFLYDYLVWYEASVGDLATFPPDLTVYYNQRFDEASSMFDRCYL